MLRFYISLASVLAMVAVTTARPQNILWNQPSQLLTLPYYGGAKGQFLQIAQNPNGETLAQRILPAGSIEAQQHVIESQNRVQGVYSEQFSENLRNIQMSAQRLVELQKKTSKTGQLKSEDQKVYATHLALLGEAASRLAKLGQNGEYDLAQLFITKNGIDDSKKTDKQDFGEEEDVGEEQEGDPGNSETDDDSIPVEAAPDSASVAEAKPVGVAIVGEGGVASSKPVATAVVGPGGLAIARPVATAIAGVDPNTVGFGTKFPVVAKTPAPAPAQAPALFPVAAASNFLQSVPVPQYQFQQYLTSPQYYTQPNYNQLYPIDLTIQ